MLLNVNSLKYVPAINCVIYKIPLFLRVIGGGGGLKVVINMGVQQTNKVTPQRHTLTTNDLKMGKMGLVN